MSYSGHQRRRGIFATAGLGRIRESGIFGRGMGGQGHYGKNYNGLFGLGGRGHYGRNYNGLFGLGQLGQKVATAVDHTAQDWSTALQTGGSLIAPIIGAATGQGQQQAQPVAPPADPSTYLPPAPVSSPSWYWPVMIGVGVAVLGGIGWMSYNVKRKPVSANRRRRMSRNGRRHRRSR